MAQAKTPTKPQTKIKTETKSKVKTTSTNASVESFLGGVSPETTRKDCDALIALMADATGCHATMWGSSIIGFDTYRYPLANGKSGEICLVGFSPRKRNLVLYVTDNHERDADLLAKLGKIETGRGCVYFDALGDLHLPTLKQLLRRAVKTRRAASLD